MAGMEQLEIHSKSYLVRWVNVKAEHSISWSVKPDKKSINFGIFKHPGSEHAPAPKLSSSTFEAPPTPALKPEDFAREPQPARNAQSTATEKLKNFGLKLILWYGACEANRVSTGKYDVPEHEGGMYALVFDNTFSKQLSKRATFVLLTYPTNSPPQSNHHTHHVQGHLTESSSSMSSVMNQRAKPTQQQSSESIKKAGSGASDKRPGSSESHNKRHDGPSSSNGSSFFTGVLQKHRRKKGQGWARRFFSLDYTSSTLSYYHDRNASAIRGAVPLSMAAIGANAKTRQISIDSGAEVWHLKASNQKDFEAWKHALEKAKTPSHPQVPASPITLDTRQQSVRVNSDEEREWAKAEALLSKVKTSRDAVRTLAKDTDPKYLPFSTVKPVSCEKAEASVIMSGASSNSESPQDHSINGYFNSESAGERRPFWKRKPSSDSRPMPGMFKRSVSATPPAITPQRSGPPTPTTVPSANQSLQIHSEGNVTIHDQCMSLLKDLDNVVEEFASLLAESKQRRIPTLPSAVSRQSIESTGSDEFFDAEGYNSSQLLAIHHESDEEGDEAEHDSGDEDSGSASEYDEPSSPAKSRGSDKRNNAFPSRPDSITPLPAERVRRRTTVPPSTTQPPSMIGIFRKNVGKDLSTISVPVSVNEPTSLLQRVAETLEYSQLLDSAATIAKTSSERLIYVTAFAVSMLASARVRERAIRKPFNPMLGETFELVREDRGFRFLAEKVSHRPVRMASQTDSEHWSLTQAPAPTQKFWGKSAEIVTEGKFRVALHATGDHFSWCPATSFLRNIIAGEKYVEPVGTMSISNSTTGEKAVVIFKSKGMFSGRSEDVVVQLFDSHGEEEALGLTGKWTTCLNLTENGSALANQCAIWSVGELVPDAARRYGFTTFAATLNEITAMEKGKLPPTDSRLRPDQRAAEDGDLDRAERWKSKLEEAQRTRRKVMEETGLTWQPQWFRKVDDGESSGEESWVMKRDGDDYWERRRAGRWEDVEDLFEQ